MRLDRWFKVYYPGLGFGQLQKLLRSGQIRVDGSRAKSQTRLNPGEIIRVPPLNVDTKATSTLTKNTMKDRGDSDVLEQMLLYQDKKVMVFNKPAGLAVQGGSGLTRHVDGMLEAWRDKAGQKPRLVHRLDRDTSGVLVVAKTRGAAAALTGSFRKRETKKIYWSLNRGVPRKYSGRISTYMVKDQTPDGDKMRVCAHGEPDSDHAVSEYALVTKAGQNVSWLQLSPITGRTHQLRVHSDYLGHPIVGDPKYFSTENWDAPGGIQNRPQLHARRIVAPHPDGHGQKIYVTAPLPPHMVQSWNLFAFDESDGVEVDEDGFDV